MGREGTFLTNKVLLPKNAALHLMVQLGALKNKALCPENDSLGQKSEGVSTKKPVLSPESSLKALNERAWSLQMRPWACKLRV